VLVVGSQAVASVGHAPQIAAVIEALGIPVYLASGARGLLGAKHPLQLRHKRKEALREADFVLLAGIPCDFRLDYGRQIGRQAFLASVNIQRSDIALNRRPQLGVHADPGRFLRELSRAVGEGSRAWGEWLGALRQRD